MKRLAPPALALALLVLAAPLRALAQPAAPELQTAVLAGGCFWGMEDVFEKLRGVTNVTAGFSGGTASSAHYDDVSTGTTGQAESVRVTFDPARISYPTLLRVFFTIAHDPTQRNRQGPDEGTQYRSVIFYANDAQRADATREIARLTAAHAFSAPIVTQVVPLRGFYAAEAYHQHYADLHPNDPYIVINDAPKVAALLKREPGLVAGASAAAARQ